ncbi:MAG TPA: sigma-70 family RNA polymerase sigma factor [Verrucomicrobiae bacterium]|jgi:RNA polymerase sigma factor (sigma-70 family)
MTESDLELLRQFTRAHSQDAFGEIVRRHVDLVYSAALRQVRSPQLAEEVAQSVFSDLAQNAGKLKPDTVLTAWLYAVARRTAVDVIRKESRRQLREQIAIEMNTMNATANDWNKIGPLLDDAMAALDDTDRSVILLRYFENKSLREVGASLKISDDAAQKRAARAVERLREFFSKRNVTAGTSALAVLITVNAVQSAPVGLATTISAAVALTGTAVSITAITTTKVITMTTLQKAVIGVVLATAIGAGTFEAHQAAQLREQNAMIQQQQAPLAAQIQQLQSQLSDATNQIAGLMEQNGRLESDSNEGELLKLRGQVTQLHEEANDPGQTALKGVVDKVNLLKGYLEQHPDRSIPELQFLTDKDWADAVWNSDMATDDDAREALSKLRETAEDNFLNKMRDAFKAYLAANNGVLPNALDELKPYFGGPVTDEMLQHYTMLQTGKPNYTATLVETSVQVDTDYGSYHSISMNGGGGSRFNHISDMVGTAASAYYRANNGQIANDAAQVTPYLKNSIDMATVQKYLNEINGGVTMANPNH